MLYTREVTCYFYCIYLLLIYCSQCLVYQFARNKGLAGVNIIYLLKEFCEALLYVTGARSHLIEPPGALVLIGNTFQYKLKRRLPLKSYYVYMLRYFRHELSSNRICVIWVLTIILSIQRKIALTY